MKSLLIYLEPPFVVFSWIEIVPPSSSSFGTLAKSSMLEYVVWEQQESGVSRSDFAMPVEVEKHAQPHIVGMGPL